MTERKRDCQAKDSNIQHYCNSCGYRMWFDGGRRLWRHDYTMRIAPIEATTA